MTSMGLHCSACASSRTLMKAGITTLVGRGGDGGGAAAGRLDGARRALPLDGRRRRRERGRGGLDFWAWDGEDLRCCPVALPVLFLAIVPFCAEVAWPVVPCFLLALSVILSFSFSFASLRLFRRLIANHGHRLGKFGQPCLLFVA